MGIRGVFSEFDERRYTNVLTDAFYQFADTFLDQPQYVSNKELSGDLDVR